MNIFYFSECPITSAKAQPDKMLVKMPLETAQMLCTAHRIVGSEDYCNKHNLYKEAYKNHPCTIWARETRINYRFAVRLMKAMNDEYMWRYVARSDGSVNFGHKSMRHFDALVEAEKYIPDVSNFMTPHPQCFSGHDDCKTDEDWPIVAYRAFYKVDKSSFARYNKGRNMPQWMKENYNE